MTDGAAIELCVCVATIFVMMYGKQLFGKSYRVNVNPGTQQTCVSMMVNHSG